MSESPKKEGGTSKKSIEDKARRSTKVSGGDHSHGSANESRKEKASGISKKASSGGDNSAADRSLGLSPGADNSAHSSREKGIPKAISSKDARNAAQVLKPQRASVENKSERGLPGGKSEKSSKSKKLTGREKALQEEAQRQSKKKRKQKKRSALEKFLISLGFSIGKVVLTDPKAVEAANALRLRPSHLRKLKMKFDAIDIDGSGNIDADEFFEAVGEQRTPFTDKLFAMIDLDGSGTIEFNEFVRVLATYCMFTQEEILRFCFQCFDVDGSGSIDEREFIELCKTVNNASPMFPANFKAALEQFDVNEDGLIDYNEFLEIDRRFPMVLFPAFRLQDFMQKNTLGEREWLKIVEEYQHFKQIEEYKALHGGRAPPDPLLTKIGKTIAPCLYREREHIKLGIQ